MEDDVEIVISDDDVEIINNQEVLISATSLRYND